MKKLIAAALALILAFSLAACGGGSTPPANNAPASDSSSGGGDGGAGTAASPASSAETPASSAELPASSAEAPASSAGLPASSAEAPASNGSGSGASTPIPAPVAEPNASPGEGNPSAGGGAAGQATAPLIGWMTEGKFSFDFTMTLENPDGSMEASGSLAEDGGKAAITMEISMLGMTIKQRIVMKDGKVYSVDDGNKSYTAISAGGTENVMTDYTSLTPTGAGTGEIKGKVLPYEDYTQSGSGASVRFYLDGGQVYGLETNFTGGKNIMIITNVKNSAPAGIFDIPADYKENSAALGSINLEDFLPEGFDMSELDLPEGFAMP